MNITAFNEPFEAPIRQTEGDKIWKQVAVAPLFVHRFPNPEQAYTNFGDKITQFQNSVDARDLRLPHNPCRLSLECLEGDIKQTHSMVVATGAAGKDGKVATVIFTFTNDSRHRLPWQKHAIIRYHLDPYGDQGDDSFKEQIARTFRAFSNIDHTWRTLEELRQEHLEHGNIKGAKGCEEEAVISIYQNHILLMDFVLDCFLPTNHVVAVRPDKKGKSGEWVKQRTHYTLITHGHPANRKGLREQQSIAVDAGAELHRMAHSRRAHYRTLRSSRFTYARGKTVFVRSSWVGPKEWKEDGSRQIYKILEAVDDLG